jgi:hypothetical protein
MNGERQAWSIQHDRNCQTRCLSLKGPIHTEISARARLARVPERAKPADRSVAVCSRRGSLKAMSPFGDDTPLLRALSD